MNGTQKLKLLKIGKIENSRCFTSIKSLSLYYETNLKVWMTSNIFESSLKNLNKKQNQKIVLFMDNCMVHSIIPEMESIKIYDPSPSKHCLKISTV